MMHTFKNRSTQSIGRLHVITDMHVQQRFDHAELAALAIRGGADVIQLREKRAWTMRAWLAMADRVRQTIDERCCTERNVAWLINDRVDVVLAAGAHGVHLGMHDMPPIKARALLSEHAWIGATANTIAEAIDATHAPVDYIGVGPVFATHSKVGSTAKVLGLRGLEKIVQRVDKPVIAIGGIDVAHVADILRAGAHGVAVISAVACDDDPAAATQRFREAIDGRV